METVGKFEFSRKDLIGHGAFAVVFKGRHKERRNREVAVKCINKKNLAKSQVLLGKEIKILKELKHENIVSLLDYQEMGGCVYLVMEYCNGGDLAEYLHSKGTLSEDTIRVFLQQIAQAMKVLRSKGILHRDLKPQNILLCHPEGRRSTSINTYIKIADFGFARHLQTDTMAATLCGSPMYMAPEVITSQTYDAKADLWSIGTIVYQCLTGKAPFHASTPQELRLFYESNRTLLPKVPKETSGHLRHLLMGLLQRNPQERMSFDEFFHHPFLETCSATKKCSPVHMFSYPSSGSGSSSSSSSTSHQVSPEHSDAEFQQLQPKELYSPTLNTAGFLEKDTANQECRNTSSYTEDYVMVPAKFPNECTCDVDVVSPIESCLIYSGSPPVAERDPRSMERTLLPSPPPNSPSKPVRDLHSKPAGFGGHSVPIPVPTQIQNYQRMEENLQPVGLHGSPRITLCCKEAGSGFNSPSSAAGGALLEPCSPRVGSIPKSSEQILPLSTRTGLTSSPSILNVTSEQVYSKETMTVPHLQVFDPSGAPQTDHSSKYANKRGPFKRSRALSTGMLSEMLLRAAFGAEDGSDESLHSEKGMDITVPPSGCNRGFQCSNSPPPAVFTSGCPSEGNTPPPDSMLKRRFSDSPNYSAWLHRGRRRHSETDVMDGSPRCVITRPPELAEDTLMEEAHTDTLSELRFTWGFVHCIMELASSKNQGLDAIISPDVSFLEQSLVTDQISLLSKEWSYSEQLVLYMKAEEFLSSALHTAKENIKHGQLVPSATVKQVIRKLNELYKSCVTHCRSLNNRLQTFLLDKQKLMDHFTGLTAEKLIYSHTMHMVQAAALDEMFHYGTESIQRYQRALLLLEGLSRMMTEQKDIDSVHKCKECIERRLSSLQTEQYP